MKKICATTVLLLIAGTFGARVTLAQAVIELHEEQYPDVDIAYGATIYAAQCVACHGADGDTIDGINLRSGRFRSAVTDRDLATFIRAGSPDKGMPPFQLDNAEMAGITAYLRNMNRLDGGSVVAGDATRGRAIFEGKGNCTECHRVGRLGSRVAPDLSDIGSERSPASLQRSLLDPSSQMMPINRPVRLVMLDGSVINGRRLNEDTYSIQLIDDNARLHSIPKAELRDYTISEVSPMPSYEGTLSPSEVADVLGYLQSLKGR